VTDAARVTALEAEIARLRETVAQLQSRAVSQAITCQPFPLTACAGVIPPVYYPAMGPGWMTFSLPPAGAAPVPALQWVEFGNSGSRVSLTPPETAPEG